MTVIDAFILGVLQGFTEFLPISSSGHLVIGQQLLGLELPGNVFEVVVHVGTLLSVLVVFWKDIWRLLSTLTEKQTQVYLLTLIVGTLPAVIGGLSFKTTLEGLFDNVTYVALALFVTGVILISTRWISHREGELSLGRGFMVGVAQMVAIIPGISRSGVTISMGLFLGVSAEEVARFSFLLAVPAIAGAGLLTWLDLSQQTISPIPIPALFTGFVSSFLMGWIALKWLLGMLASGRFYWFGVYCIFVALITLGVQ
jgi:undecaprenyl-diphosphatase